VSEKKDESQPSTLSEAQAEEAVAKAEFEAAKEEAQQAKPDDDTLRSTTISDAVAASEAVTAAEAAYEAAMEKAKAARATSEAVWKQNMKRQRLKLEKQDRQDNFLINANRIVYFEEKWGNQNFS